MKQTHRERKRSKELSKAFDRVEECEHKNVRELPNGDKTCDDCGGVWEPDVEAPGGGRWLPDWRPGT